VPACFQPDAIVRDLAGTLSNSAQLTSLRQIILTSYKQANVGVRRMSVMFSAEGGVFELIVFLLAA
jgi:hypothetical protein